VPVRAIVLVLVLAVVGRAEAQQAASVIHASPWALGVVGAGGAMVTDDQRETLGFGGGGGMARIELRARPFDELGIDWIETQLGGAFTLVGPGIGGNVGGVLDFDVGARIAPRFGDARPYLSVGVGVAFTGPYVRPVGNAALGVAFQVGEEIAVGPELGLQHVIQWDGRGYTSDAVFLSVGAAITYRPVPHPPAEPEVIVEVIERETVRERPPQTAFDPAPPAEPTHYEELEFLVDAAVCGAGVDVVTLLPPVLFDHDASELTDPGEVAMHDVLTRVLAAADGSRIVVEGHADATGTSEHNERLALARAHTVASWLIAHGVAHESLRETGHGDRAPLVDGETDEALAPNRRVTIRIEHDGAMREGAR